MLSIRRGRIILRRLYNDYDLSRNYCSRRHKEPKDLSWQWSVKKRPELMNCKNVNVPKICPKPSFFPRFKKVFIPADKKSCVPKKTPMSWKEYWSFLLPDQGNKPPLITCRKLQAQRRKCCHGLGSKSCGDDGTRGNCCPPPKEWYGQAEIFVIPSSLPPIGEPPKGPEPCAPPPPSEPSCVLALKGVCPIPKKTLNMDDYAYKKAFSGVNLCDEMKEVPTSFKVKGVCVPQLPEGSKSLRLSCGYFSEFKEVECPKAIAAKSTSSDMPALVCKDQQKAGSEELKEKEMSEVKKGVCGSQTFLKPYDGEQVPEPKKIHTLTFINQGAMPRRYFHSTSQTQVQNHETNAGSRLGPQSYTSESNFEGPEISQRLDSGITCQPSKSAVGLHYTLLKPLSGRLRDGLHAPPPACRPEDSYYNHNSQGIDPELSKLAETTKKNMTYGLSKLPNTNTKESTTTLAKELSKMAEERFIKRAKEKGVDRKAPASPTKTPYPPSKLTLLKRKKIPTVVSSQATFMTEAMINVKQAKKKDSKNKNDKKDFICAGCPGIKAAEEEEKNPSPKSFLNCKVRPAGRCRGPQRKVFADEGEPKSPYLKCKQKPYSLCNQPRPVQKKEERPYKMPCEENTKRRFHMYSHHTSPSFNINKSGINKFHSTTCLNDSSTNIPTIYDLLKERGVNKCGKHPPNHANDWDSHTSDSYGERTCEEYDSLPDLSKYHPSNDDNSIKKMSYPINLWEYPDNKKKSNYNSWTNTEGNKIFMGPNRNEATNSNAAFVKRKPVLNLTKDSSVNSPPSKYNVLFNPTSMKNQTESIYKNTHHFTNINKSSNHENKFKNLAEFKENNAPTSKNTEYNFNSENKTAVNASTPKEIPLCPITTQNMWGDSFNSTTEQSPPSVSLVPQETKSWEKAWEKSKSHALPKDNLMNECSTHSMFRPAEEKKKVPPKPDNDGQPMFFQEKMLLSGPGNSENPNNINESKQE